MAETVEDGNEEGAPTVWTIGHSTRALEDLIQLLRSNEITNLVDVRSYPASQRYPHFNKVELKRQLLKSGIDYHHFTKLGGRRTLLPDSKNTAWRDVSFRAYADYMESAEFKEGIEELLALARHKRTAIMCAEAVWWRCHRALVADYLKARGSEIVHIVDAARQEPHPYTAAARLVDGELSYSGLFS